MSSKPKLLFVYDHKYPDLLLANATQNPLQWTICCNIVNYVKSNSMYVLAKLLRERVNYVLGFVLISLGIRVNGLTALIVGGQNGIQQIVGKEIKVAFSSVRELVISNINRVKNQLNINMVNILVGIDTLRVSNKNGNIELLRKLVLAGNWLRVKLFTILTATNKTITHLIYMCLKAKENITKYITGINLFQLGVI